MSACPGGDLSVYGWGGDSAQRMLDTCRPLGVTVYKLKDQEAILQDWKSPEAAPYKGMHGIKMPVFGEK